MPLVAAHRVALERAIATLDVRALPRFRGTCPTASDGPEWIYRFRGTKAVVSSCRYDLRGVPAVALADRIGAAVR